MPRTKVLIIDDCDLVRRAMTKELSKHADLEVVGEAPDAYAARTLMFERAPDVLSLDLELPRMNGLEFLKKIIQHRPLPVVVVSSLTTAGCQIALACLEAGAVDVLSKPGPGVSLAAFGRDLAASLRVAAAVDITALVARARARAVQPQALTTPRPAAAHPPIAAGTGECLPRELIVLGTSIGGPEALRRVLSELPPGMPPIVIVQHMPPGFIEALASRLNGICSLDVQVARAGEILKPGTVRIAPGDMHAKVIETPSGSSIQLAATAAVCGHRPSVEVLFESVARLPRLRRLGVILTGMGEDGADGLLSLRQSGAHTIAQDEASCVVFGMPRGAVLRGAVSEVLGLDRIAGRMVEWAAGRILAKG